MLLAEPLMVLMKSLSSPVSRDRSKGATKLKQKSADLRQVNLTNKMMKSFKQFALKKSFLFKPS